MNERIGGIPETIVEGTVEMVEYRVDHGRNWVRQRSIVVDGLGFFGVTEFGPWKEFPAVKDDETDARFGITQK